MDNIMIKSDWDYRGLAAECYDLWFGDEPFWDQAFFHDRIRHNGGVALEIACGTGRLLVPFLRDGLTVEGVDASEEMLAICRAKAAHMGVLPTLYHQLMQDLDLAPRYRTMYIPACSFQILAERDEAFAALRRFYTHLEPGGELLLTLMVPGVTLGSSGSGGYGVQECAPLMGPPSSSTKLRYPTASSRCSTSGCVMRSSKRDAGADAIAGASVAVVPQARVCHDAGIRGLPRGYSAVWVHRQRPGESEAEWIFIAKR
jgi:SAM-dependent methyltransferase